LICRFWADDSLLGRDGGLWLAGASGYSWPGNGGIEAALTDDLGSVTSSVATLTVTREPLRFDTSPFALQMTNGGFRLRLLGLAGAGPGEIYASSDLVTWATVFTHPPLVGPLEFIDPMATNDAQRYYRAREFTLP